MILNIESDLNRFKQIVKGNVRRDLKRYMGSGELTGKQGDKTVNIPLPQINIPRFRYGQNAGGIGQGEGEKGGKVDGAGEAGDKPGEHALEVEVTLEELATMIGEELNLPPLLPKGQQQVEAEHTRYTAIAPIGPRGLLHGRRTWRRALARAIADGSYHPGQMIVPQRGDMRFRAGVPKTQPHAAALAIYVMDVSGSMGQEQKDLARQTCFWINAWLRKHFKKMEAVFIIHDAKATEVDEETFFRTKESGGTLISSAYRLAWEIIQHRYPPDQWNIFMFQFSDGDNWTVADTGLCLELLDGLLLPAVNLFGYGQVDSPYGSGDFYRDLLRHFADEPKVRTARLPERSAVMAGIKSLLG